MGPNRYVSIGFLGLNDQSIKIILREERSELYRKERGTLVNEGASVSGAVDHEILDSAPYKILKMH